MVSRFPVSPTPRTPFDHVELLAAALDAAHRGWPVFPCRPGRKEPMIRDWEPRATLDVDHVERAWTGPYEGCNIGIATGPAGLVVIDLDMSADLAGPSGAAHLAALCQRERITLPDTYTVTTPSGGRHLYHRAPSGVDLRNTQSKLAPKIDTRAGGGYVVAPGSRTPAGQYRIVNDQQPADLPPGLFQLLAPTPLPPPPAPVRLPAGSRADRYVAAALAAEADRVTGAAKGQRNHSLYVAACALGQLILQRHLRRVVGG